MRAIVARGLTDAQLFSRYWQQNIAAVDLPKARIGLYLRAYFYQPER